MSRIAPYRLAIPTATLALLCATMSPAAAAELFLHAMDGPGFDADFGYGNTTATVVGSPAVVEGTIGNAISFNAGSGDDAQYLSFDGDGHLNAASGSVSFWYRPNFDSTATDNAYLFAIRGPSAGDPAKTMTFRLYYRMHGTIGPAFSVALAHPDGASTPAGLASTFADGQWVPIGVTWNQINQTQTQVRLQVDGQNLIAFTTLTERWFADTGAEFIIGNRENGNGPGADGAIDNVRINEQWLGYDFTAVPEPSSLGLLTGAGLLGLARRRHRQG